MKTSTRLLAAVLCCASSASATEWQAFGPRAMAMGGSGVALAHGALANYWNPAGLGQTENPSGVQVPIGIQAAITGPVLQGANDMNQIEKDCQDPNLGPNKGTCTQANLNSAISELSQSNSGVRGALGGGADVKVKRLDVFVNDFAYVGAKPYVDATNVTPLTLLNNQSSLVLRGLNVTEIGVGYGRELDWVPGLLLGGNVKGMIGKVGYYKQRVVSNDSGNSGSLGDFTKNSKTSFQPGIDLGALWDVDKTFGWVPMRPRVGLTARNVNNPKFKQPDIATANGEPSKFSLQGNMRLGAAISPLSFWNVTADMDLTRNLTPVDGVASRMIGLGTEVNVFNRTWIDIPLRVGLARNTADTGKTMITGGFGLHFLHVELDLGAMVSPARQETQSQGKSEKVPSEFGGSFQLGVMFGGEAPTKD